MKLAIVGSRSFYNYQFLEDTILELYSDCYIEEIVSGGARGVDTLAREFANNWGIPIKEFIPEWDKLGKRAGMVRNKDIIDYSTCVAAFWDLHSPGTKNAITLAKQQNKLGKIIPV